MSRDRRAGPSLPGQLASLFLVAFILYGFLFWMALEILAFLDDVRVGLL